MLSLASKKELKILFWVLGDVESLIIINYNIRVILTYLIQRYSSLFDNVVFAIINDHNSVGNYEIFKSQL
jgi:hypothetical protein